MILKIDVNKVQFAQLTAFLVSGINQFEAPAGFMWSTVCRFMPPIKLVSAKEFDPGMSVVLQVETIGCAKGPGLDSIRYALPLTPLIQMFQAMGLAPDEMTEIKRT